MRISVRIACAVVLSVNVLAQDPEPEIVTSDIVNFWKAHDASTAGDRADVFQRLYFDQASPGLRDFIRLRIQSAQALAQTVDALPKYYASIRENTLKTAALKPAIQLFMGRFRGFYRQAQFPPIYFLIGRLSSGGTVSQAGLLIGTEVFSSGPGVDTSELQRVFPALTQGGSAGFASEKLPFIVVHELAHTQLRFTASENLLNAALIEGAADFLSNLVSGRTINEYQASYAEVRREELFKLFAADVRERPGAIDKWLYNLGQTTGDQPFDLGYWIGHEICRDYYARAENKDAAIEALATMRDPESIVRGSSYAWILPAAAPTSVNRGGPKEASNYRCSRTLFN